jgi:hypothetical protein
MKYQCVAYTVVRSDGSDSDMYLYIKQDFKRWGSQRSGSIFPRARGSMNLAIAFLFADTVAVLWPLELSSWNGSLRIVETQKKRK